MRRFTEPELLVGRAEAVGLRFDPAADREVSARHARFERRGDDWWIVDLQSRNGTWLGGERLTEPRRVEPGARVRFGWHGPEVEVLDPGAAASPPDRVASLESRSRMLTVATGLAVVALVGVVAASLRSRDAARTRWERERATLEARTDSVLAASRDDVARLRGEVAGLADALEDSRGRVRDLQTELTRLGRADDADPAELAAVRRRLERATAALARQQLAATLDAPALTARVRPAVALIYVEFDGEERSLATGFAVREDGLVVTNRHVVAGADGGRAPERLGVQFSGSPQVWPADVVEVDTRADLALLRTRNIVGGVPVVPGLNSRADTLGPGTPVLLLGFPYATPPAGPDAVPRALSTAGVLSAPAGERLEIQGWGAQGASGSPVVDARGELVGILYGAAGEGEGRRLVAVPAAALAALLDRGDRER